MLKNFIERSGRPFRFSARFCADPKFYRMTDQDYWLLVGQQSFGLVMYNMQRGLNNNSDGLSSTLKRRLVEFFSIPGLILASVST